MTRFLRPCLMLMLHREPSHGYQLLSGLDEFGIDPDSIDPSLIYRTLRNLENDQMVQSRWGTDSKGPRRRVYSITDSGEEYLAHWINELQHTRASIDSVLEAFDQLTPRKDGESNDRS
ncbi:MAG: PadR family transcriptional regulator [Chloroflexota bacterium]